MSEQSSPLPTAPADAASVHRLWAHAFAVWSNHHAFGVATVSAAARRAHLHAHNAVVAAAVATLRQAEAACAEVEMALVYRPLPADLAEARAAARRALRLTERDARACLAVA